MRINWRRFFLRRQVAKLDDAALQHRADTCYRVLGRPDSPAWLAAWHMLDVIETEADSRGYKLV